MTECSCTTRNNCLWFAVIASAFVGIIVAVLRFTAIITVGPVFSYVALGFALLALLLTFVASIFGNKTVKYCLCKNLTALIIGILGTTITVFVVLTAGFSATSALGAVFIGLVAAAISLVVTSIVCVIRCALDCGC